MRRLSILMAFLLSSLTASFSQNLTDSAYHADYGYKCSVCSLNDTTSCYGIGVRKKIATKLLEGERCDTLLDLCEEQLLVKDSMNKVLSQENTNLRLEFEAQKTISTGYKSDSDNWEKAFNRQKNATKWVGWVLGGTTLTLGITVIAILVSQ